MVNLDTSFVPPPTFIPKLSPAMKLRALFTLSLCSFTILTPVILQASDDASNQAAEVEADNIEHVQEESKVIATGNVSISHSGNNLQAEKVIYNQADNEMIAQDNVKFTDVDGNVYYADDANFTHDLQKGTIDNLRGRLSDGANISALSAERDGEVVTLNNGAYSPCKACPKSLTGQPAWQVTSQSSVIDNASETVTHKNMTFDVFGVPVFYLPYLTHPTPDAQRKSGFLAPSYGSQSHLGHSITTPYYWNIAPNMDLTLSSTFTSEGGPLLATEFRHATERGEYEIEASITNPEELDASGNYINGTSDIRGHIAAKGHFALNELWDYGFDINRATDDTYTRRYDFHHADESDLLTSEIYVRRFEKRNYLGIEAFSFQGLNATDDPASTPLILPMVTAHYEMPAHQEVGSITEKMTAFVDLTGFLVTRDDGAESQRLSIEAGYNMPFVTQNGQLITIEASVRGDGYHVDNVTLANQTDTSEGTRGRIIPELEVNWRYPLLHSDADQTLLFEPMIDAVWSPNGNSLDTIPNEDSVYVELSDFNIFSDSRFTGIDAVEDGLRFNYGFNATHESSVGIFDLLLGQTYRLNDDNALLTTLTGLDEHFSDYVGRLHYDVNEMLDFSYRFRFDKDSFEARRTEINTQITLEDFEMTVGYNMIDTSGIASEKRDEIVASAAYHINDNWSVEGASRYDFTNDNDWVSSAASVIYENECIRFTNSVRRTHVRDRDIEPSTSYTFNITLKTFGDSID